MIENIMSLLGASEKATPKNAADIINKAVLGERLTIRDIAVLIHRAEDVEYMLFGAAARIRQKIYGKRMVLFAPLYLSNWCANDCLYCGFRISNKNLKRRALTDEEIEKEVRWLHRRGYRRILLEAGERKSAVTIDRVISVMNHIYSLRDEKGRPLIDRINVNIAATTKGNYQKLLNAKIGTYNLFQETYHYPTYAKSHPSGPKRNFTRQLGAPGLAIKAGIGDIGMGVLYGLYDWRFETLSLILHALDLEERYGIGPHAISFPRVKPADGVDFTPPYPVDDATYLRVIAIMRIALPYAGLVISTREPAHIRRQAFKIGISQTSAGSAVEVGGYSNKHRAGQFTLADERPLEEVIRELLEEGFVPAFCTGCEQHNRTGTAFMRVVKKGEIGNFCTVNSLLSLAEYLRDSAKFLAKDTISLGLKIIEQEIEKPCSPFVTPGLRDSIMRIMAGENAFKFYI